MDEVIPEGTSQSVQARLPALEGHCPRKTVGDAVEVARGSVEPSEILRFLRDFVTSANHPLLPQETYGRELIYSDCS